MGRPIKIIKLTRKKVDRAALTAPPYMELKNIAHFTRLPY
jgi:hypothetical protein